MVILISGASHTGKTFTAQKLLEKYKYPYLSLDHLKMGLCRSGRADFTPLSEDDVITNSMWEIVVEMIKTAIENHQNLIVEGCYIPFDWKDSFEEEYRKNIKYICLVMSESYIREHFDDILEYENVIEKRLYHDVEIDNLILDNKRYLDECKKHGLKYILFDSEYRKEFDYDF